MPLRDALSFWKFHRECLRCCPKKERIAVNRMVTRHIRNFFVEHPNGTFAEFKAKNAPLNLVNDYLDTDTDILIKEVAHLQKRRLLVTLLLLLIVIVVVVFVFLLWDMNSVKLVRKFYETVT